MTWQEFESIRPEAIRKARLALGWTRSAEDEVGALDKAGSGRFAKLTKLELATYWASHKSWDVYLTEEQMDLLSGL